MVHDPLAQMESEVFVVSVCVHYSFFDRHLECVFPGNIADKWDLLYGRFRTSPDGDPHLRVVVRGADAGPYALSINDVTQPVPEEHVMLRLQDMVQNHVLPAVRSHVLWHAALWSVEGRGLMILGAAGLGKTTLSLAHHLAGGRVLSDEIAAWHPETSLMSAFPRALAVRPDSLAVLDDRRAHRRVMLDEEKALVPLPDEALSVAIPLSVVCMLERPADAAAEASESVFEMQVRAPDEAWRDALRICWPEAQLMPHPDGEDWWRGRYTGRLRLRALEEAVRRSEAVLEGFHRGARRQSSFAGPPVIEEMDSGAAAGMALAEMINGRTWGDQTGALRLMAMVRTALRPARCIRCVPGRLEETHPAILQWAG